MRCIQCSLVKFVTGHASWYIDEVDFCTLLSRDSKNNKIRRTIQRCKTPFISRDLQFMCEHEFNLVVLIPVKPRRRSTRVRRRSVHTSSSHRRIRILPNPRVTRTNNTGPVAVSQHGIDVDDILMGQLLLQFTFIRRERIIKCTSQIRFISLYLKTE